MDRNLYTAKEMSRLLKLSEQTVWRLGREGKLKRVKLGRTVRFEMPKKG